MMNKIIFLIIILFASDVFSQVISGNVTDSISQTGIANAKVLISNINSGYIDSVFTNASWELEL